MIYTALINTGTVMVQPYLSAASGISGRRRWPGCRRPTRFPGAGWVGDRDMGVQIGVAGTAVPMGERGRHQALHLNLPDASGPGPRVEGVLFDEPQSIRDGGPVGPFYGDGRGLVGDRPQRRHAFTGEKVRS